MLLWESGAEMIAHKTVDGVRIQATASKGITAFIASTIPEVHQLVNSGMVEEGLITDVRYLYKQKGNYADRIDTLFVAHISG